MTEHPATAAARWEARIFFSIGLATGALAPLAPRATVPVLFIAAAGLAIIAVRTRMPPPRPGIVALLGILALVLWGGVSAAWSISPADSLRSAAALAGLLLVGLAVAAWARSRTPHMARGLYAGLGLGLLIYAFEGLSWGWLTRIAHGLSWPDIIDDRSGGINVPAYLINGTAILSLLFWPAACALVSGGRRWAALGLGALIAAATAYFGSDAGLIALAAGAVCWAAALHRGARAARAIAVLFAASMLAMPVVLHPTLQSLDLDSLSVETRDTVPSSAMIRLHIWKFTAERIAERPVLGWGFDAARRIPGGGEKFTVRDDAHRILFEEMYLPLHPHNQILQIWLELGAIGALIVAVAGACLIDAAGRWPAPAREGILALAATAIVYGTFSFGAWQSWWIAAVLIGVVLLNTFREPAPARL